MSTRRDRDNFRSHPSGHQKRLKQVKTEQTINKQRGAFDKFLSKTSAVLSIPSEEIKNENYYEESVQTKIQNNILDKDNFIESDQTIKENKEVEQLGMEICEVVSDNCAESKHVQNDTKKLYSEFDDIGCWPVNIDQNIRTEIITYGPKQV